MTGNAAPGWYPEPGVDGTLRYWDGTRWTDSRAPTKKRRRPVSSAAVIVLICFVIGLGLLGYVFVYNSPEREAVRACKDAVERQLKSPSSAEYSTVYATDTGDDGFNVVGYVDAENGFGASVRNRFECPDVRGSFTIDVEFDD